MTKRNATNGQIELTDEEQEKLDNGETVKISRGNRTYEFEAVDNE